MKHNKTKFYELFTKLKSQDYRLIASFNKEEPESNFWIKKIASYYREMGYTVKINIRTR